MNKNENAIIFYGLIQPDKEDKYWKQAAAQYDRNLEEKIPMSAMPAITMGSLTAGIHFISIFDSEEIVHSDEVAIDLDIAYLLRHPVEQWNEMLLSYCSNIGIQVHDQEPTWHLALQENWSEAS
jgi:hypothetical protein